MPELNWDEFDVEPEDVSEGEAAELEKEHKPVPIGKYLCRCVESTLKQIEFERYVCAGVRLKWEIEQALEIEAKPVTGDGGEDWEGRYIYDDVALFHSDEKEAFAKRRKTIALKTGIIRPGEAITKNLWRTGIIGRQAAIRLVENCYKDKRTGEEKTGSPRIDFFKGYESVGAGSQPEKTDWSDI